MTDYNGVFLRHGTGIVRKLVYLRVADRMTIKNMIPG
jgi:hypothetical protein